MRTIIDAFAQYERALMGCARRPRWRASGRKGSASGRSLWLPADGRWRAFRGRAARAGGDRHRAAPCAGVALSYRAIAAEVNQRGLTNRAGGPFHKTQMIRMLEMLRGAGLIDLPRVRHELARLDALLAAHPELRGAGGPDPPHRLARTGVTTGDNETYREANLRPVVR